MKTVGDYYNDIELAKKTVHDIQIIVNDFPKGSYIYDTLKTAREFVMKYQRLIMEKEIE